MNCTLRRHIVRPDGIFGIITDDSTGKQFCVSAEHSYGGKAKVPAGKYLCVRYVSPKFRHEVFLVTKVPGATVIELHRGNYPQTDSDGCILLGEEVLHLENGSMAITKSKAAFERFMAAQGKDFWLTIR